MTVIDDDPGITERDAAAIAAFEDAVREFAAELNRLLLALGVPSYSVMACGSLRLRLTGAGLNEMLGGRRFTSPGGTARVRPGRHDAGRSCAARGCRMDAVFCARPGCRRALWIGGHPRRARAGAGPADGTGHRRRSWLVRSAGVRSGDRTSVRDLVEQPGEHGTGGAGDSGTEHGLRPGRLLAAGRVGPAGSTGPVGTGHRHRSPSGRTSDGGVGRRRRRSRSWRPQRGYWDASEIPGDFPWSRQVWMWITRDDPGRPSWWGEST